MASLSPSNPRSEPGRVLVTGAGGFLGTHMCRHFGKAGHPVAAVGRFHDALDLPENYPNLVLLGGMTLPDPSFTDLVERFRPDLLVHCAGTSSVKDSVEEPYRDFQRTVDVCAFTLETLRRHAPRCHFVLLSSASVYGNPAQMPVGENCTVAPISPYGWHKLMCEQLAGEYGALHGLDTCILRIFSAYGEHCRKQVLHDLCSKLLRATGPEVEVIGTGDESRDFIHARDVAMAVDCLYQNRGRGVFNLGSGRETRIRELVPLLCSGLGIEKAARFTGQTRAGDPLHWRADISKLQAKGFAPVVPLEEGVPAFARWWMNRERMSRNAGWTAVPQSRPVQVAA